jgi:hypothetical protein
MNWDVNKPRQLTNADTTRCAGSGLPLQEGRCCICRQILKERKNGGAALHEMPPWMMEQRP